MQPLANLTGTCGIKEASQRQTKSSYIKVYHPPLWLWNVDNLLTAYKKAKPLSHNLSKRDSRHHIAKTHPCHQSFNSCFSSQHLHHLDAITALLGQSCLHERSPPPKETALLPTVLGQALPRRPEKCFKDTLKVSMKSFGVTFNCLEYLVQDRDQWREVRRRAKVWSKTEHN